MANYTPGTANALHGTTVYGSFIGLSEAKEYLQYPADDESHDAAFQRIVDAACTWVQTFCGRPIGKTLYKPPYGRFSGGAGINSSYIALPRFPVLQILSVIEFQGSTPVALSEVDPASGSDGYTVDYSTGIIERVMGGVWQRPFMPSERGVLVTWYAGFDPIPADIWLTTMNLIDLWFRTYQQQGANKSAASNPMNNGQPQGPWGGVPAFVKSGLQPYILPSIN